jgi:hypothetical protein
LLFQKAGTMNPVTVRVGFVPSYRFGYTAWGQKMRDESLAALARVKGLEIVAPQPAPESAGLDPARGVTPHGMVATLDEAEAVAEYFRLQKVDGLILYPVDFGDERSAVKVAEKLRLPVLLYATKEPPAATIRPVARVGFLLRHAVHSLRVMSSQDSLPLRRSIGGRPQGWPQPVPVHQRPADQV